MHDEQAKAPAPAEVDQLAKEYLALKTKLDEALQASFAAQEPIQKMKERLIEKVREFGSTHAEKSKLLHGIVYEMLATFGSSISLDAAAVEAFRVGLVKAGQPRLLKKIFEKSERWTLSANAAAIVKGSKLSKPLLALYSQCQVTKSKAPMLQVREKAKQSAA
jgi:hypothetical protein